jgi:DNA-binding MarR family transcriptional regulator
LANSLVDKGYVRRAPNPEDGRSIVLQPTARAGKLVERVKRDLAGEYVDILAELDAATRRSITRVVGRLATAFTARVETSGGTCCVIR